MTDSTTQPCVLEGAALTDHINNLNARVLRGEEVSDEEIRSAVLALRTRRKHASSTSGVAKKAATPKAKAMDMNDILSLFKTGDK
jgi:hypothetical protein